ncbi:hypothetical protein [Pedobacter sp. SYSU D00535]|uniref:hypothetical protein n=1 Tax=Pedobacter sp. SYSU D00535 TaxID=2810308 RepID=UPI001A96871B|nr:hypothetical protein [Pedobacter sp. SYSU D00535]
MRISTYSNLLKNFGLSGVVIASFFAANTLQAQNYNRPKVNIGLVYPISTNGTQAAADTNVFSLNAIAGLSAEEQGVAIAGFSNVVKNNATGVVVSGFSNHIGKKTDGVLVAGFANTYGAGKGFQVSGFSNVSTGNVEGAQFAGFLNTAQELRGAQFAGFSNHATTIEGTQFAGFVNTAKGIDGSQFAGFGNTSRSLVSGSQLAGFINTAGDVEGSQVAGFINIARKVKGAQIAGFINIADSSDCPIGIINIIRNGEKSIGFSIDETQTAMLSFRSGGKIMYGILGVGYNFKNEDEVYAMEAGLGAHLLPLGAFRFNTEATFQTLESFNFGEYFKTSLKLMPSLRIAGKVELFGGTSLNFINTNTTEGKNLSNHYIWERQHRWSDNFSALYIGYTAGINLIF